MPGMREGRNEQLTKKPTYEDWLFEYRKRLKVISAEKGGYFAITNDAAQNLAELSVENASLRSRVKELEDEQRGIIAKRIQPCGCVLCFCESDRCRGCGAKKCDDPQCNVRKGILEYEKHPRLALLEGLLREAKPYIHDFPLMDDCGGHCKVCDAARELHSRIAAAIEQKGEHPLPEEQKEKTP